MTAWRPGQFELRAAELDGIDAVEGGAEDAEDAEEPPEPSRASAEYAVRLLDAALLRIDAAVTISPDDSLPLPALLGLRDRALGR